MLSVRDRGEQSLDLSKTPGVYLPVWFKNKAPSIGTAMRASHYDDDDVDDDDGDVDDRWKGK